MIKLFLKSNQEEEYRSVRVVQGQTVTFGSSPMADFYLASDALDEIHCRLAIQRAGCFLECISNHSFFFRNGKKMDRCRLKDGDVLGLAEFEFQVEIESKVTLTATQSSPKDFSENDSSPVDGEGEQTVEDFAEDGHANTGHANTGDVQISDEKQINEFVVDASDTETAEVDSMDFKDLFEQDLQYSELGDVRRAKGLTENGDSTDTSGSAEKENVDSDSTESRLPEDATSEPSQNEFAQRTEVANNDGSQYDESTAHPTGDSDVDKASGDQEDDLEFDDEESVDDPGTVEPELFDYDGHDSSFDVDSYSGELLYEAVTDTEHKDDNVQKLDIENEVSKLADVTGNQPDAANDDVSDDIESSVRCEDSTDGKDAIDETSEQENVLTGSESAKKEIADKVDDETQNSSQQNISGKPVFSARLSNNGSVWRYSINPQSLFNAIETARSLYRIKAGRGAGEIIEFDFETQESGDLMIPAIFAIDPASPEDLSVFAMQYRTRIQHPRALSTFLSFAPKVACEKFFASISGVLLTDQFEDPEILTLQPPNEFGPAMGGIIEFE